MLLLLTCGLGSRCFFTPSFLDCEKKYSRNLTLRSKFFDGPRKNLAGSGSSSSALNYHFQLHSIGSGIKGNNSFGCDD